MDDQIKAAFQGLNTYAIKQIQDGFNKEKLTAYEVKSLENEFFIYWNEAVNQDVEIFWQAIDKNKLPYKRKSPIKELLKKTRFRRVEQWIDLLDLMNKNFVCSLNALFCLPCVTSSPS